MMKTPSSGADRPKIAVLVSPQLRRRIFTGQALQQLASLGHVVMPEEDSIDEQMASSLLEGASICITGWDTPSLHQVLAQPPAQLHLIGHTAGSIHFLLPESVFASGIHVTHAAAALSEGVAEFTILQILLCLTRLHEFDRALKARSTGWWELRKEQGQPDGHLLQAQTVGLVGASHIGREVLKRLQPFGCRIVMYDPYLSAAEAEALHVELLDLDTLFATADIVSLHAPLLPSTRNMIGAVQLQKLRDGAIFLNTARARLVDEDALLKELQTGRIMAALDVFHEEPLPDESPLRDLPNVILSPHIACLTRETLLKQGQMMVDEAQRFLQGKPLLYEIKATQIKTMA